MKRVTIICAAMMSAICLHADEIGDVAARIVLTNPERQAQLQRVNANTLADNTENNLADPELSVESLFGKTENKYSVELTQSFDWPSLYKARKERNSAARAASLAEIDAYTSDLQYQAETLLINLIGIRKKTSAYRESLSLMQRLLDTYTNLYARGEVSIIDVNKLRIEVADYSQALADEEQRLMDTYGELTALSAGIDIPAATASLTEFPLYTLKDKDVYIKAMEENSPQLQYIRAKNLLDEQDVKVASMLSRPGFSVGYRYSYEDSQSYNGFAVGLTLPFWSAKGKKEAAQAAAVATTLEETAAINTLRAQIDTDYSTAQSTYARITQYSRALNASDNTGILKRAFDAGQITLTNYLQDLRYFIEAQIRLIDLQQTYATSTASLKRYDS